MACLLISAAASIGVPGMEAHPAQPVVAGERVFASRCSGCHGLDGRGGEHAPDIATEERAQSLSDSQILATVREGKPTAGMPGFRSVLNDGELNALLAYLRILQGKHEIAKVSGRVENGRLLFFGKAKCAECHVINGKGGFIASDLTGFGNKHSVAEIRSAIIDPDQRLHEKNRMTAVKTREGALCRGVIRNEDNFSLQMQTLNGSFYLFDKADIDRVELVKDPFMPTDYESKFNTNELDDLVSYIANPVEKSEVEPSAQSKK